MTYVIALPCVDVKDLACVEECPVDCIYEGEADALHPPRRVRRLRGLRAGLPGRGDLLRGRRARRVAGVLRRQRRTSSTRSVLRAAPPSSARSTRTTPRWPCSRPRASDPRGGGAPARLPLGLPAGAKDRATAHPDGIVDLSVGTPVDPTPEIGRRGAAGSRRRSRLPDDLGDARAARGDRRLPPATMGRGRTLRRRGAARRRHEGTGGAAADPAGLGAGHSIVIPTTAYPTYDVGGRLRGATVVAADDPSVLAAVGPGLVWINSPANPHGTILGPDASAGLGPSGPGRWARCSPPTSATASSAGKRSPSRCCTRR